MRVAVIGHVEHATIARVDALPAAGTITHIEDPLWIPGGGGGIAFHQLSRSPAEVHLYTAVGDDDAAAAVLAALRATGAAIHAARRAEPHTRDLVLVAPGAERTILVIGRPLHPRRDDPLPWDLLSSCDAVYFTGQDPHTIVAARAARVLVVTARRADALARAGVRADVVVGSSNDPREKSTLADYPVAPGALVMTRGGAPGTIETKNGAITFPPPRPPDPIVGTYGAGDTFAGALTWYLALGLPLVEACTRAGVHAAAVLAGANPLEEQVPLQ
jgi:ribokinase